VRVWKRAAALDAGMLVPIKAKLGPGQRTRVRCRLCGVRVRKWRLGDFWPFHGQERAFFTCHCAGTLLYAYTEADKRLWESVSGLAASHGFIEAVVETPGFEPLEGGPFSPN
jgi:hypothetical protein